MRETEPAASPLQKLTASILDSARYRTLCPDVVARIGAIELAKRKTWKEAEKETRNRLHQIGGAYLDHRPPYGRWLEDLGAAPDSEAYLAHLRRMMLAHASTRERLPYLDTFYFQTLGAIRPIRSVVDVACGFNPLALPWMGLEPGAAYQGYDLFSDMAAFTADSLRASVFGPPCDAVVSTRDVAPAPPDTLADLALILKFLPLLEQTGTTETVRWLKGLRTRHALVSFPTRTLSGRNVGMATAYEARFREVLRLGGWHAERREIGSELCFLVQLGGG